MSTVLKMADRTCSRTINTAGEISRLKRFFLLMCGTMIVICLSYMTRLAAGTVWDSVVLPQTSWFSTKAMHVAFLKTHKTGSTSVQNIFIRFGDVHDLTFVIARVRGNECNENPNCISFNRTLYDGNILPPPSGKFYEILCSHVIYDRTAFLKYLPRDTRYIGLVREPISRFESARAYFETFNASLEQFAKNPTKYPHDMTNNRMALEFGFKLEWFPTSAHPTWTSQEKAEAMKHVDQIMVDFDLILINERLVESLVLMRRLLHWSMKDIIYQKKLVREHSSFQSKDTDNVKKYLYLDYLLYNRALETHIAKTSKAGNNFTGEVGAFKHINYLVNNYCECGAKCTLNPYTINQTQWSGAFTVTDAFCVKLGIPEIEYLDEMRARQHPKSFKLRRTLQHNLRVLEEDRIPVHDLTDV